MPIKVTCKCGKALNVKDELGGKTVKCPGCQQPLKIPAAAGAAVAAPKAASAKPAVRAQSELFDELGLKPLEAGTMPCPGCKEPLTKNAIICVKCGYNMNLGRRMTTQSAAAAAPSAHEGGHGDIATGLLERAAQVIDEDAEEAQRKTTEGMPWWVYLILLLVLCGFLGTMMVIAARKEAKPKDEKVGFATPVAEFARIREV